MQPLRKSSNSLPWVTHWNFGNLAKIDFSNVGPSVTYLTFCTSAIKILSTKFPKSLQIGTARKISFKTGLVDSIFPPLLNGKKVSVNHTVPAFQKMPYPKNFS